MARSVLLCHISQRIIEYKCGEKKKQKAKEEGRGERVDEENKRNASTHKVTLQEHAMLHSRPGLASQ